MHDDRTIRIRIQSRIRIHTSTSDWWIRIRIQEAQKQVDPEPDSDPDPQHWFSVSLYIVRLACYCYQCFGSGSDESASFHASGRIQIRFYLYLSGSFCLQTKTYENLISKKKFSLGNFRNVGTVLTASIKQKLMKKIKLQGSGSVTNSAVPYWSRTLLVIHLCFLVYFESRSFTMLWTVQVVCGVPDSIELSPLIHGPTGLPPCPATARAGRIATQAYRYSSGSVLLCSPTRSLPGPNSVGWLFLLNRHTNISVADPDPGSGALLTLPLKNEDLDPGWTTPIIFLRV